jgi:hypothetical protein
MAQVDRGTRLAATARNGSTEGLSGARRRPSSLLACLRGRGLAPVAGPLCPGLICLGNFARCHIDHHGRGPHRSLGMVSGMHTCAIPPSSGPQQRGAGLQCACSPSAGLCCQGRACPRGHVTTTWGPSLHAGRTPMAHRHHLILRIKHTLAMLVPPLRQISWLTTVPSFGPWEGEFGATKTGLAVVDKPGKGSTL